MNWSDGDANNRVISIAIGMDQNGCVQAVAETGFEGDNCEMPTIPTCVFSEGGVPFSCSAGFIYNSANDMNGRDSTPAWPDACCHTPICSNTDAAGMP